MNGFLALRRTAKRVTNPATAPTNDDYTPSPQLRAVFEMRLPPAARYANLGVIVLALFTGVALLRIRPEERVAASVVEAGSGWAAIVSSPCSGRAVPVREAGQRVLEGDPVLLLMASYDCQHSGTADDAAAPAPTRSEVAGESTLLRARRAGVLLTLADPADVAAGDTIGLVLPIRGAPIRYVLVPSSFVASAPAESVFTVCTRVADVAECDSVKPEAERYVLGTTTVLRLGAQRSSQQQSQALSLSRRSAQRATVARRGQPILYSLLPVTWRGRTLGAL
jgi:hypothetical protein